MRVRLKRMSAAGFQAEVSLDTPWACEAAREALETAPDELGGSVELSAPLDDGRVDVRCRIDATGTRLCERCGESTEVQVVVDTLLLFFPEGQAPTGTGEIELDRKDLDVGWYSEDAIELAEVVQEAMVLAMPARVMCANAEECDIRTTQLLKNAHEGTPSGHPAFAALRNLN